MQSCVVLNPQDAPAEIYIQRCQNFLKINHSDNWEEIAKKVEWSPELLSNEPIIDQHHKELFVRVKNLIMSIGSGKTEEEVYEMIHFLEDYIVTHFELEEMYMAQYHYPYYAIHKEEHIQFMANVRKIKQDYKSKGGNLYLALQIQQDIVDWLTVHIGEDDKELAQFLQKNR
jgi:hemerythrin